MDLHTLRRVETFEEYYSLLFSRKKYLDLLYKLYVLENEPFNAESGPHSGKWPLLEARMIICFTIVFCFKQLHDPSKDLIKKNIF